MLGANPIMVQPFRLLAGQSKDLLRMRRKIPVHRSNVEQAYRNV
jgi:hypothetical protein